jgi:hypothetical protein
MSVSLPMLPATWTSLASRPREIEVGDLVWQEFPQPVLGVKEARKLAEKGAILMASRHTETTVELVIRSAGRRKHR